MDESGISHVSELEFLISIVENFSLNRNEVEINNIFGAEKFDKKIPGNKFSMMTLRK